MESSDLQRLIISYKNEKSTTRILPYIENTINNLSILIKKQTEYINSFKQYSLLKSIYEQELERVKYFLKEYLLTRIKKIENNLFIEREHLSSHELVYLDGLIELYKCRDIYIEPPSQLPTNEECVGFVVKKSIGEILIDGHPVNMEKGDFFVAAIDDVIHLLYNNDIELI
ncbi:DNA replication complex GINS protein sld5 [Astathelohania contejeani]|uniref:DNA replication complex GINS protein SLD5 n=1 Tax=Astathelohania contejeani TaxID=164912 RepID=A0ABQ7I329_9MICR|nr:DNA replication complex GINS protein sld5 [Thelohania contejeani]